MTKKTELTLLWPLKDVQENYDDQVASITINLPISIILLFLFSSQPSISDLTL